MPKKVDHNARRTQIAKALMRIASERGFEGVSLRHVAAEAGVSLGLVQHYFRSKDEMMLFALTVVSENVKARFEPLAVVLGKTPQPETLVRTLLLQILPLDETRRAEGRVALAFLAYAAVKPSIGAALRKDTARLRKFVADQIRIAGRKGKVTIQFNPTHAATGLLALIEGLNIHVLGGHYKSSTAKTVFDLYMKTFFGISKIEG